MQAYLPFYFDWANHLSRLSDAEYGRLIKSILAFAMGVEDANHKKLSPSASMAYEFITSTINRAEAKRNGREQAERTIPAPAKRGKKTFKRAIEIEAKSREECMKIANLIHEQLVDNEDYVNENIILKYGGNDNCVRLIIFDECKNTPEIKI